MRQDVGHGPVPGTPGNLLGVDSNDDAVVSPSHLLGGARSKAKAKPGPRRTGYRPMSRQLMQRAQPQRAKPIMCQVLAVSIAVARRTRFRHCVVFVTTFGKCHHHVSCFKLENCTDVRSLDPDDAIARGLRPCKKCIA